jgi:hypothetical protein
MGELDGAWLARLPFGVERAVVRLTVAVMDLTAAEKREAEQCFASAAKHEGVPTSVAHLSQMVASLVGSASAEVARQSLVAMGVIGDALSEERPVSELDRAFAALPVPVKRALVDVLSQAAVGSEDDRAAARQVAESVGGRPLAALVGLVGVLETQQRSGEFKAATGVSLEDAVGALQVLIGRDAEERSR